MRVDRVHDCGGILIRADHCPGSVSPYTIRAKFVEDPRGWDSEGMFPHHFGSRPQRGKPMINVVHHILIRSLRTVCRFDNITCGIEPVRVIFGDTNGSGIVTVLTKDGIQFLGSITGKTYKNHPHVRMPVEGDRFVGDDLDWVVAITDAGLDPALRRSDEIIGYIRRMESLVVPDQLFG